jgi:hypothetical protein
VFLIWRQELEKKSEAWSSDVVRSQPRSSNFIVSFLGRSRRVPRERAYTLDLCLGPDGVRSTLDILLLVYGVRRTECLHLSNRSRMIENHIFSQQISGVQSDVRSLYPAGRQPTAISPKAKSQTPNASVSLGLDSLIFSSPAKLVLV